MKKFCASSLAALGLGLASQAAAITFRFQYGGTVTATAPYTVDVPLNAPINLPTSTETATKLSYKFSPTPTFTDGTGTITTTVGTIDFTFEGDFDATGMDGALLGFGNGTGAYAGYTGSGIVSHTVNNTSSRLVGGQIFATLQAVPEPSSMLALSVAGAAIFRRRARRAAL